MMLRSLNWSIRSEESEINDQDVLHSGKSASSAPSAAASLMKAAAFW